MSSYDRKLNAEIDKMGLADLVHYMIVNFSPAAVAEEPWGKEAYAQGGSYFHAYENLQKFEAELKAVK